MITGVSGPARRERVKIESISTRNRSQRAARRADRRAHVGGPSIGARAKFRVSDALMRSHAGAQRWKPCCVRRLRISFRCSGSEGGGGMSAHTWGFIGLVAAFGLGTLQLTADAAWLSPYLYWATGLSALGGVGSFLWPLHRRFPRRSPIRLSLDRDATSDLIGIQTFPGESYIQVTVRVSRPVAKCRVRIERIEFLEPHSVFTLEHNEARDVTWSDRSDLQIDLSPADPPMRCNPAWFTPEKGLRLYPKTPTNLTPLLQRVGIHRFTLNFSGQCGDRHVSKTAELLIDWRGSDTAFVRDLKTL
jgi:hypothetical protein